MGVLYDNLNFNKRILLDLPFREGRGTITQDVAKPHHPVTLLNTPTWTSLDSGLEVLDFNGTNEYLQCVAASCTDLNFTSGDYSLGGWFYFESGGTDDKTLMSRFLLSNNGWELYHYTNAILTLRHHHAAGASVRTGAYTGGWSFAKWWFMGISRDGAVAKFYRGDADGFAPLTTTVSTGGLIDPETCTQNLYIGQDSAGENFYNGMQWRPRVWDVTLTEDDWQTIYELEKGWFA